MRRWKAIEAIDRRWSITQHGHTPYIKRKRILDPSTQEHCMGTPALQIEGLHVWYGELHILHGANLTMNHDEVVTLPDRNGADRTTALRAIADLVGTHKDLTVVHDASGQGVETIDLPTHKIAHCDVGYCPEERDIFSSLSYEENLILPPMLRGQMAKAGNAGMSIDEIYETLLSLAEHRQSQSTYLSSDEQQMLAIGCILCAGMNLLLLNKISGKLTPMIVQALARMILVLKKRGYTVVMAEQNFCPAAPLTNRFYVMEHSHIIECFEAAQLQNKMPVLHKLLGV